MKFLSPPTLPSFSILEFATSPVPDGGVGTEIFSPIAAKMLTWNGTLWTGQVEIKTYIQNTQPTDAKYIWWQTIGGNLTLWIQDGT